MKACPDLPIPLYLWDETITHQPLYSDPALYC